MQLAGLVLRNTVHTQWGSGALALLSGRQGLQRKLHCIPDRLAEQPLVVKHVSCVGIALGLCCACMCSVWCHAVSALQQI